MIVRYLPNDEIYHHGVKGMHWGVRRYQKKDGSLTLLGQHHINALNRKEARDIKKLHKISENMSKDSYYTNSMSKKQLEKGTKKKRAGDKKLL